MANLLAKESKPINFQILDVQAFHGMYKRSMERLSNMYRRSMERLSNI